MLTGAATAENSMQFSQRLKIELPYDTAIPLLGIYLEKPKTHIQKDTCTPMFTAALFTVVNIWKQPKCPSKDKWMKGCVCVCVCIERERWNTWPQKNEILPFAAT